MQGVLGCSDHYSLRVTQHHLVVVIQPVGRPLGFHRNQEVVNQDNVKKALVGEEVHGVHGRAKTSRLSR